MPGSASSGWRRFAGVLGLLGIVVYSGLIPGHLISQLRADLVQATLGDAYTLICHSNMAGKPVTDREDGKSKTNCPFCKNFASFHFTAPSAVAIVLKHPPSRGVLPVADDTILRAHDGIAALSRGPPALFV